MTVDTSVIAQAQYVKDKLMDAVKAAEGLTQAQKSMPEVLQTQLEILRQLQDATDAFFSIIDRMQNYLYAADQIQTLVADHQRLIQDETEYRLLRTRVLQRINKALDEYV